MTLSVAMQAALEAPAYCITTLCRIDFASHTARVLDGAIEVVWDGGTWSGVDSMVGAFAGAEPISDGVTDEAQAASITFNVPVDASVADLIAPENQGVRVRLWQAVVDEATGELVPDPYLLFDGLIDVPVYRGDGGMSVVEYRCNSFLDKFAIQNEARQLSDAAHRAIWPGETGLADMTGIDRAIAWGGIIPSSQAGAPVSNSVFAGFRGA